MRLIEIPSDVDSTDPKVARTALRGFIDELRQSLQDNFISDMDVAFAPLIKHAESIYGPGEMAMMWVEDHMYMGSDEEVSWFKHRYTRETLTLPKWVTNGE